METRNIKVTLNKAKEWYKSGNSILKELALQAFSERELERPTFAEISKLVLSVEVSEKERILAILAEYYRGVSDKFYPFQEKYAIGKSSYDGWTVIKHTSVLYPGVAYYLREEDAKEALEIFLEEIGYNKYKVVSDQPLK